jgi:hypothetical protein
VYQMCAIPSHPLSVTTFSTGHTSSILANNRGGAVPEADSRDAYSRNTPTAA